MHKSSNEKRHSLQRYAVLTQITCNRDFSAMNMQNQFIFLAADAYIIHKPWRHTVCCKAAKLTLAYERQTIFKCYLPFGVAFFFFSESRRSLVAPYLYGDAREPITGNRGTIRSRVFCHFTALQRFCTRRREKERKNRTAVRLLAETSRPFADFHRVRL